VIKGKKRVYIKNKIHTLRAGQGVIIPKGNMHRVFNSKNTWALSVGFK
jgi:mannose-6-phosphate isomerase-like protein (cupin superfamily)